MLVARKACDKVSTLARTVNSHTGLHTRILSPSGRCLASLLWRLGPSGSSVHSKQCRRKASLFLHAQSSPECRHRVVFLGTPEVAAQSLQTLLTASATAQPSLEVVGVVTQPGRARGRGKQRVPQPSPVEQTARDSGLTGEHILVPESARNADFLDAMCALEPDLCITAAYGNILPQAFLNIPRFGTLNIHPSLLPAYRGAAPVQRALLDGVAVTGVSVAFTVRAMDAGPILAQERVSIDDQIQAPELLQDLFARGTQLLLQQLPLLWEGRAPSVAQPQEEDSATHAAKLSKSDSLLDFREPAAQLHNKVRALAGWPGTVHNFQLRREDVAQAAVSLKILATRLSPGQQLPAASHGTQQIVRVGRQLFVRCGDGGVLELLKVQPAGKSAMSAAAFANGLGENSLICQNGV